MFPPPVSLPVHSLPVGPLARSMRHPDDSPVSHQRIGACTPKGESPTNLSQRLKYWTRARVQDGYTIQPASLEGGCHGATRRKSQRVFSRALISIAVLPNIFPSPFLFVFAIISLVYFGFRFCFRFLISTSCCAGWTRICHLEDRENPSVASCVRL